jgi:hypothetical protein
VGARAYSPTVLESFATWLYRFLLQGIQQLRPREEIQALDVLDPLTRGAFIHAIQMQITARDFPLEIQFLRTGSRAGMMKGIYWQITW